MAKQRYVNTTFWRDDYIAHLDPSEKLIYLYLLTNPDTTISGIYQIPLKTIAVDTGYEESMIVKIVKRFESDGKIMYKEGRICIKNFQKNQALNPKIQVGIKTEMAKAPQWAVDFINTTIENVENIAYRRQSHLNTNTNTNTNGDAPSAEPAATTPATKKSKDPYIHDYDTIINGVKSQSIELYNALSNFQQWRKSMKKPMTGYALHLIIGELNKLYPNDIKKQIECVNQSIRRGWLDVFAIKQDFYDPQKKTIDTKQTMTYKDGNVEGNEQYRAMKEREKLLKQNEVAK